MNKQLDIPGTAIESPPAVRIHNAHKSAARVLNKVEDRADREMPGWFDEALEKVRVFARSQGGALFTCETMRWMIQRELPTPPELRVYGMLTRKALARGYIKRTDRSAPTVSSRGSPRPLYSRGPMA